MKNLSKKYFTNDKIEELTNVIIEVKKDNIYEKVLKTYFVANDKIEELTNVINKMCIKTSFSCKGIDISKRVIDLLSRKYDFIELCATIKSILSEFSNKELILIKYKYGKCFSTAQFREMGFNNDTRQYFRAQQRILKKFTQKMFLRGYDDENLTYHYNYFIKGE